MTNESILIIPDSKSKHSKGLLPDMTSRTFTITRNVWSFIGKIMNSCLNIGFQNKYKLSCFLTVIEIEWN